MAPNASSRSASVLRIALPCMIALAGILWAVNSAAAEIYHWTDANGVAHFSDRPPTSEQKSLTTMAVDNPPPADYDPDEDRYNISATAERTQALRDEQARTRQARNAQSAAAPPVTQTAQPQAFGVNYGRLPGSRRPGLGRPPRPEHPDRPARPESGPPPTEPVRPKRRSHRGP